MNKIYNIGEYIKINPDLNQEIFYHNKMMKIINYNYTINIDKKLVYILDKEYFKTIIHKNIIYFKYCYQDAECIKKSRINKLKRIING